jgi:hypothetical protein
MERASLPSQESLESPGKCLFLSFNSFFMSLPIKMYVLTKFYRNGPDICLNISCRKTVYKTLKRKGGTGRLAERPCSGRPRLSNVRDDRAIITLSLRDRRETVPFLRASWESYRVSASLTTVRMITVIASKGGYTRY